MSDAARRAHASTLGDYERFVAGRPDEDRWELVDGVIEMMTNPTENHGQIVGNLYTALRPSVDLRRCRAYAGSTRVQRSEAGSEDMAVIPDILVRCGPSSNATFITDPLVVVEVLSRSTMDRDRGPKLGFYKTLPTLEHIVIIYQDQMRVEHYRRVADGWSPTVLRRPSDRLSFDTIDFETDLETVYFDVRVLRPLETTDVDDEEPPWTP